MQLIYKKNFVNKISSYQRYRFSSLEFPFKGYNPVWDNKEKHISTSILDQNVVQSIIKGHDYFKTLLSVRKLPELGLITTPMLNLRIKEYYELLDQYKLSLSMEVNNIAYTSIVGIYSFDQLFGVDLDSSYEPENYNKISLFNKKYFKKIFLIPKKLNLVKLNSVLALEILYRTEILINVSKNNTIEKRPVSYENCLLQYVCSSSKSKELFKVDGTDSSWKISNINRWIDEKDYQNIFQMK